VAKSRFVSRKKPKQRIGRSDHQVRLAAQPLREFSHKNWEKIAMEILRALKNEGEPKSSRSYAQAGYVGEQNARKRAGSRTEE